ncbi:23S rRNA (uracil(1939)-C(5))-methyltransferase RlmD [Helicovermis profundi]|uniref:23S rRNA (Uracil(1939)-C(5))-methyltransferase RlmD n=1 Tax=Helicovermis profundi TaxID=3065157 RepID=A0AAU9E718_9FIRM|nr:23S rRNA (uracil(1939)-C(5))-methyltransferase RlmD [Clostridia bacterium S502]
MENKIVKKDIIKKNTIRKNDEIEIVILEMGEKGQGIAYINDLKIFIDGGVVEDRLIVKIVKISNKYLVGKLLKVIEPSKYRIIEECKYSRVCGGCQYQSIDYKKQLDIKRDLVINALKKEIKIDEKKIMKTIGMDNPYKYRNKAQFPINKNGDDIVIGFYKKASHILVDIDDCILQNPRVKEIVQVFKKYILENNVSIYNSKTMIGVLRYVVIRSSFLTNEDMLIVVTSEDELVTKDILIKNLRSVKSVTSIIQNVNKDLGNKILGTINKTIYGKNTIMDSIGDIKYNISPLSFFQVNSFQTKILYDKVGQYANLTGEEIVFDLYSGIGSIALTIAKNAKKVYGVEIIKEAVDDARENARLNNIKNVEFIVGRAEEVVPNMFNRKSEITADLVIVDPPRKGCDRELLSTIVKMKAKKLIYVSCKPASLARDLKYLVDNGFVVEEVTPVDMFSWTSHVEVVLRLTRKNLLGEISE